MADKTTASKELKLGAQFYDNDDRTLSIDNPKNGVTAAQIKEFATVLRNTAAIIGDKSGAEFVGFKTARVVEQKRVDFDLR